MTGAMPIPGISYLGVTVLSVQDNVALVRDQMGRQFQVRRDFQRAKGAWPETGEQWIVDKPYGNEWSFAMLITPSQTPVARPAVMAVADQAARDAILAPASGQMALRLDSKLLDYWDGAKWRGTQRAATVNTTTIDNATKTASTVYPAFTVADPGWPYRVRIYGQIRISVGTATGITIAMVDGTTTGSTAITPILTHRPGVDANNFSRMKMIEGISPTYTGGKTFSLVVLKTDGGGGDGWNLYTEAEGTKVYGDVIPSFG